MEFRFLPRQKGHHNQKKNGAGGRPEWYDRGEHATDAEVRHVKNSRLTPYVHKPNTAEEPPQDMAEGFAGEAQDFVQKRDFGEAVLEQMMAEKRALQMEEVELAEPDRYMDEPPGAGHAVILPPRAEDADNMALGTDGEGKVLFEDDVCAMIREELRRRQTERLPLELQWQLNGNYYDGNQYCDINPAANEIMQYTNEECCEGKQHEVFNRIAPLIETRVANLKKINYTMDVKPATNELSDIQKARVSSEILRHTQQASGFNAKKDAAVLWNELCGSCFFMTWWNPTKGELCATVREAITDEDGSTAVKERSVREGDVDYGLLTAYEVYPESIYKQTVADQQSIIVEQVKTVDEIEELYGFRPEGEEIDAFTLIPTPAAGGFGYEATVLSMGKAKMKDCQRVTTYFERKSKAFPQGRMAIMVGEDKLVYYGAMPYDDIPIIRMVCKERAGQFFGKSVIEELIPLQRAYNSACNDIADYLKQLKAPQYLVLEGSVDMDEFESRAGIPGAVLVYRNPGEPPIPRAGVQFSGEVFTQKYDLERQMEYVAAVSQLMVYGETPNGVTSGTAIESLRDIDNTRLALTGDYIRNAVLEMARFWLSMYKKYANTYRIIRSAGKNEIGNALVWNREDVTSYDVAFSTENELLYSEQNQWQRLMQVLTSGVGDQRLAQEAAEKAREFIKVGAYRTELSVNELQTQAAALENALLDENVLPSVREYDDHALHAEQHLNYILQMDFETLRKEKPTLAQQMIAHWKEHMQILQQNAAEAQAQASENR